MATDTWTLGCAGGAVPSLVPHAQVLRKTLVGTPTPSNYYYYYYYYYYFYFYFYYYYYYYYSQRIMHLCLIS